VLCRRKHDTFKSVMLINGIGLKKLKQERSRQQWRYGMNSDNTPQDQGDTSDSLSTPDQVEERRAFLRKVGKAALAGGAVSSLIVAGMSLPTQAANAYGSKFPGGGATGGNFPGGGATGGKFPGGKKPGGQK
jgi:hypothetical protein